MRFQRRDHQDYIGGYDPEHEMPDPDEVRARIARAYAQGYSHGYGDRDRDYYSRGYPRPFRYESEADRKHWEREYENEYGGRPDDPNLRYDRDFRRRY